MKITLNPYKSFLFCIFLIFCNACIHESLDNCDASVCFHFYYDINKEEKDNFTNEVHHIYLIICDEKGELYQIEDFNISESIHYVNLPYGKYKVIAWGNIHTDDYELTGTNTLENMRLSFTKHQNNIALSSGISSLFYAGNEFEVNSSEKKEVDLRMMKNTNRLKVIVKGLSEENNSKSYNVSITGKNHIYDYYNLPPANLPTITYTSNKEYENENVIAEFDLLRLLSNDTNMQLYITKNLNEKSEILFNEPFIHYLIPDNQKNPQLYLDKNDYYEMTIEFYGYKIRIKVGDWVYETNNNWLQ